MLLRTYMLIVVIVIRMRLFRQMFCSIVPVFGCLRQVCTICQSTVFGSLFCHDYVISLVDHVTCLSVSHGVALLIFRQSHYRSVLCSNPEGYG